MTFFPENATDSEGKGEEGQRFILSQMQYLFTFKCGDMHIEFSFCFIFISDDFFSIGKHKLKGL